MYDANVNLSSKVIIPFNFGRAAKRQLQERKAPFPLMCWDDDIPRKLWSEDGHIMVATMPKLTDSRGTVRPLSSPPPSRTLMSRFAGSYHP